MNIKRIIRRTLIRISPKTYVVLKYKKNIGGVPNLKNPQKYTEKIVWRMLYEKNDDFTRLADKVLVRDWIGEKLGKEEALSIFPKTYGIFKNPDEIDFDKLPNSFVLKPNHASGYVILCEDKSKLDIKKTRKTLKKWLKCNFYYEAAEWHYKNIRPQIICEELLDSAITDYRFFCFKGDIAFIRATVHDSNSPTGYSVGEYTDDWKQVDIKFGEDDKIVEFKKPEKLDQMVRLAKILSENFNFVRVDLYNVGEKVYFSEMTFAPNAGGYKILPEEFDYELGRKFVLGNKQEQLLRS